MRSTVLRAAALVFFAGATSVAAQEGESPQYEPWEQELYEAAQEEGQIVWYVSQTTSEFADQVCNLFQQTYPGVECSAVRATGSVTFQRVMQEVQAQAVQGDVYSSNDTTDFLLLSEGDALLEYLPQRIDNMLPNLREAGRDGLWFTSNVSPYGIVYNTGLVADEEAPQTWTDLLDPKWKGQVGIAHPGFSGSMGMYAIAMRDKYGWEYFEKFEENDPYIGRSIADGFNLVVSGERKVAVAPVTLGLAATASGDPVQTVFPEDGLMLPPSGTGILADAPHPNAAKLFEEFLLSEAYADLLIENLRYPLIQGVELPEGMPPLDDVELLTVDPESAATEVVEIQDQFRATFGI